METVHVPFGDNQSDTATLLLAAAEEAGQPASVVGVDHFTNSFTAPAEVAKKAGLDTVDPNAPFDDEVAQAQKSAEAGEELPSQSVTTEEAELKQVQAETSETPAKKTAAKKTAAKKTTAKKATARKSTAKKGS